MRIGLRLLALASLLFVIGCTRSSDLQDRNGHVRSEGVQPKTVPQGTPTAAAPASEATRVDTAASAKTTIPLDEVKPAKPPEHACERYADRLASRQMLEYTHGNLLKSMPLDHLALLEHLTFVERLACAVVLLNGELRNPDQVDEASVVAAIRRLRIGNDQITPETARQFVEFQARRAKVKTPEYCQDEIGYETKTNLEMAAKRARTMIDVIGMIERRKTKELNDSIENVQSVFRDVLSHNPDMLRAIIDADQLREGLENEEVRKSRAFFQSTIGAVKEKP